ncbi:sodium:solute symporter [Halobacteriovorax marinus]|uniref:Sodium:solute symporter n=1 Tax=Halobacteriovorax marinus TaxID=97084 RepID=A0A1Y5FC63_9BACT|nr:sodium:solute symporter [Halobacteriovorax marinus]
MNSETFKYVVTFVFVAFTFYLSYLGMKKTKDLRGFSIGNKDMGPVLIGITMAASISSTATFVINPGFVYTHGLAAYLHYAVAASFGIITAFLLLTKGFRKLGESKGSLTIPDWIYHRYQSRGLSLFFAVINLLSVTFVVLILVGCSILLSSLFPVSQKMALVMCITFVFSYVLMGGTYAHAYTNTFQGILMVLISLFLFGSGLKYFEGGFLTSLQSISQSYASIVNPDSHLYYDYFSVFISSFLITFALMFQPHIFSKILYIRKDEDVSKFIATTFIVGTVFGLMLFVGFYAKLSGLVVDRQDMVVSEYIIQEFSTGTFGPYILVFITLTLLAAGLSTLDGILVSLSAMVVNDIYLPFFGKNLNEETRERNALKLSRVVLIVIGLFSFALAWSPPMLVGLFAQKGIYALAAASFTPILLGVLMNRELPIWLIGGASLIGFFGHLILNLFLGFANPSVSSSISMISSLLFAMAGIWFTQKESKQVELSS